MKPLILLVSGLCLSSLVTSAHAADYYSSPGQAPLPNHGYSSSGSQPTTHPREPLYQHRNKQVSISVNLPARSEPAYYASHGRRPHFREPTWARVDNRRFPTNLVIGGHQPDLADPLYVCRGEYQSGMHPGKLIAGQCNISWGGNEIRLNRFQVLTSHSPLAWIPARGYIPPHALPIGHERGRTLYACQAEYRGGLHPGKVIGNACNIGWGGREISLPYYNILVKA